jgi:thiol-disulfide isomerase/thioredoxin
MKKEEEILNAYFHEDMPVLYENIQYTSFFSEFFKAMYGSTKLFNYDEIVAALNSERGYINVDRLLMKSASLKNNPEVRELSAMVLMAKKYYSPDTKKYKVLNMLNELQRNSKYAGVMKVAGNYMVKLPHLEYGSPAPPFELVDASGTTISLSQFEGKFVLLNFNREDCPLCLHYFKDLELLRKQFDGKLQVISVVTREGFKEMTAYSAERSYEWPVLNLGKDILILEDYNIRTYPSYLIINPDNTIATAYAPLPEEGLDFYISRYMSQFERIREGNRGE